MLDDVRTEAARLIGADSQCRNTVAVIIVGGGEGNTAAPRRRRAAAVASTFTSISSRRVPIYVIAIAPPSTDVARAHEHRDQQRRPILPGGQGRDRCGDGRRPAGADRGACDQRRRPAWLRAIPSDVNTAPTASLPYGPLSEFQVTSPIVGTVNLKGAHALDGSTLPDTDISSTESGAKVPQRANVLVTSGFALPGFDMRLRAFRVYKPVDRRHASRRATSSAPTARRSGWRRAR